MYEAQREQILNTQFNVDQAQFAHEQLQTTIVTVDAIKASNSTMQTQMQKINIDDVEDIMDDMEELMINQQEVSEILGRNYAVPEGFDEGALDAEFAQLEEECALDAVSGAQAQQLPDYLPSSVPTAPSANAPTSEEPLSFARPY